jgi:hypothetical protein
MLPATKGADHEHAQRQYRRSRLPGASFEGAAALAEHRVTAEAYEAAVRHYGAGGEEAELWDDLAALGFDRDEIQWHLWLLSRRYRWLSLSPMRASPPATITATQLTHFGADQSPTMSVHSAKIRTRWNNATAAKIIPATKENVFWSMARIN